VIGYPFDNSTDVAEIQYGSPDCLVQYDLNLPGVYTLAYSVAPVLKWRGPPAYLVFFGAHAEGGTAVIKASVGGTAISSSGATMNGSWVDNGDVDINIHYAIDQDDTLAIAASSTSGSDEDLSAHFSIVVP